MRLIPAIDLRGGRCVRLRQGDFRAETVFDVAPRDLLERYRACGADWVHVVDLDGARDAATVNQETIVQLATLPGVQLQVGGGLRSRTAVLALCERGIARAVVGSLAVSAPAELGAIARELGAERIVIALDVRIDEGKVPRVATHGWREQTAIALWDAVEAVAAEGLTRVLCTDVARDGMLAGPNLDLYREAGRRYPAIEWQASGGIRDARDLAALAGTGVAAAVSGRALLEGRIKPEELRPFLPNA
jgi:phosphoribosylformimino-5-aminoimidazole carboxamide ribotide isomerase